MRHIKEARKHMKDEAKAKDRGVDTKPKANQQWITGADLVPVINFLSS